MSTTIPVKELLSLPSDGSSEPDNETMVDIAPPVIIPPLVSMRNITSVRQAEFEHEKAAVRPQRQAKKADSKPKVKVVKSSTRRQTSEIVGVIIPPPRVIGHLRAGLETNLTKKHAEANSKIRKLKAALSKTELSEEDILKDNKLLTDEQRVKATSIINVLVDRIKEENLGEESVRLSDNTGPALASALDSLVYQFYDLAACNTVAAGYKVIDGKFSLNPADMPGEQAGGLLMQKTAVGPFFFLLPTCINYNQKEEDALCEERRNKNKEKRALSEAATSAKATAAIVANAQTKKDNVDEPVVEAPVVEKPVVAVAKKVPAVRKAGDELSFLSYIETICTNGRQLHPDYTNLRVSQRFKDIMDQIVQEFIKFLSKALRCLITTHTIQGSDIKNALAFMQQVAGRPESEIEQLQNTIDTALNKWELYSEEEKLRRAERQADKVLKMSVEERDAYKERQRITDVERLESSVKAQLRRAQKAEKTVVEKQAKLAEMQKANTEDAVDTALTETIKA